MALDPVVFLKGNTNTPLSKGTIMKISLLKERLLFPVRLDMALAASLLYKYKIIWCAILSINPSRKEDDSVSYSFHHPPFQ